MVYHFNDFTIVQLIHLLKGGQVNWDTFSHSLLESEKKIQFGFSNPEGPNAGEYILEIGEVINFLPDSPSTNTWGRNISQVDFNPPQKCLTLAGPGVRLEIVVAYVRVSAHKK